jgi:hypothetical protein
MTDFLKIIGITLIDYLPYPAIILLVLHIIFFMMGLHYFSTSHDDKYSCKQKYIALLNAGLSWLMSLILIAWIIAWIVMRIMLRM